MLLDTVQEMCACVCMCSWVCVHGCVHACMHVYVCVCPNVPHSPLNVEYPSNLSPSPTLFLLTCLGLPEGRKSGFFVHLREVQG